MIEGKSVLDLVTAAKVGASLELDARQYSVRDLTTIVSALQPGAHMRLFHWSTKSPLDISAIVRGKQGQLKGQVILG